MKPRILLVVLTLVLAALACNMPVDNLNSTGTPSVTGTAQMDVLTAAAQTAQFGQTEVEPGPSDNTNTPKAPTRTRTPGPTAVPPTDTPEPCDQAQFIQDVTIPDGAKIGPGQAFTKTWRLRNIGKCNWDPSYAMVLVGGNGMGAPAVIHLPGDVPSGETVDLSIDMKAPTKPGNYVGNWKLRNAKGTLFGVYQNQSFYVDIQVTQITPTVTVTPTGTITPSATPKSTTAVGLVYDFASKMCEAEWRSQSGVLTCPGSEGDSQGYVLTPDQPTLETGGKETRTVLLTVPDSTKDGAITGLYPAITIQKGYHLLASLGCLSGDTRCSIIYQVNYTIDSTHVTNLYQFTHTYNGQMQDIDIDLSPLAGKKVQLVLVVLANGSAEGDNAVWVAPRIISR